MPELLRRENPWLPYVAPITVFLVLTAAEGLLPKAGGVPSPLGQPLGSSQGHPLAHPAAYPVGYAVKVLAVIATAWWSRRTWKDFRPLPRPGDILFSVGLGLAVAALWVGLDGHYPALPLQGSRVAFDPHVLKGAARPAFLAIRFFGLVALVPVIEELFWRSFLVRWVVRPDFDRVPLGHVTWRAAAITSALFALAHPEWLPALVTGFLWVWLLRRTGNLTACLISHVVANLTLGVYVLLTGSWRFW